MSLPHCPDCTYSDVQEVWQSEPVEVLSVPCAKHQPPWWGTDARPTKHQNEHPLE